MVLLFCKFLFLTIAEEQVSIMR